MFVRGPARFVIPFERDVSQHTVPPRSLARPVAGAFGALSVYEREIAIDEINRARPALRQESAIPARLARGADDAAANIRLAATQDARSVRRA